MIMLSFFRKIRPLDKGISPQVLAHCPPPTPEDSAGLFSSRPFKHFYNINTSPQRIHRTVYCFVGCKH